MLWMKKQVLFLFESIRLLPNVWLINPLPSQLQYIVFPASKILRTTTVANSFKIKKVNAASAIKINTIFF